MSGFKNNGKMRVARNCPRSYPQVPWMPFLLSPVRYRAEQEQNRITGATDVTPSSKQDTALRGYDCIQSYLRTLDSSPGVYRMLDAESRVLYVGKARNLKNRVSNYARPGNHSPRITRMIQETAAMMFLTTKTETEALLLEQNLIKQLKPRYNVLLRDDKSFPNILVSQSHAFPQIKKHRGAKKETGRYYGPFASAGAVNRTLNQLQRIFLLRNCSDSDFETRTRPCLQYQIKRCSGPCVGLVSEADYAKSVADAEKFLSGRTKGIQEALAAQMSDASAAMEFERAAALRDRIKALTQVQSAQGINPQTVAEGDIIALHIDGGQACVQVFFIRANQNWGNHDYYPRISGDEDRSEVMEAFVGQFYANREPPRAIILSHGLDDPELMADALSEKAGRKVEITVPQRGEKAELVNGALRNARESLARKMSESATQGRLLKGLAQAFDLDAPPTRIEVYDNSHIQGAHAVGAMIVAGPEGFEKNQYRKFNIRGDDLTPGDDFGMMKEVLTRRFKRLLKEDPDRKSGVWPDLLLIDGGAGQVSAVRQIMTELGVDDVPMVGVAKGEDRDAGKEEFHRTGKSVMALRHNDPVLYFIQRMRDEAHRFAIGTHRAKRTKAIGATPLDDVPGVGATRKRALLAHFGSAKAVARANLADLKAVEGVSDNMAQTIYDYFHENG
ncbi:Excinuclease ABC subunit C [Cognatiyoonia koreensis]|uniref:UvrABC system protein C n=1 Tax=Cognatiyoonia koreensis TaxID=364200 RepID=A0A1I0RGS2_9RHOB|nr:Excinuclease ABC subunit C [Cognatiyoonia koreensis]